MNGKCRSRNTTVQPSAAYTNPERHNTASKTDGQTDRQTADNILPVAYYAACSAYDRLIKIHQSTTKAICCVYKKWLTRYKGRPNVTFIIHIDTSVHVRYVSDSF